MSPLITAFAVGLLQGILEWLPISSQGNLILFMVFLLGMKPIEALSLSIYVHLGSGLAVLLYFRKNITWLLRMDSDNSKKQFRFLIVTTIVTGVLGLPLFLFARITSFYGELLVGLTGVALILTGVIEKSAQKLGVRTVESLNLGEGFLLGIVQAFSAIPGISRSGVTTSALLLRGLSGEQALKTSFIMGIPAVFSAIVGLMIIEGNPQLELNMLVAIVASLLSSFLFIDLFLKLSRTIRFWIFCILLGAFALLPLLFYFL